MMIETRNSQILQKTSVGDLRPDPAWIESQIGVLRSQNVAAYVVKQLRLAEDREFIRSNIGPFDKLLARFGWGDPEPTTEGERTGAAIGTVMGGLDVRRVGQSYMMRIDFSSPNREQAGRVAGAMIDAYIFDQLNSKYQANRRAGDWLQERLQALREQAAAAERAVVEFKAKNNIEHPMHMESRLTLRCPKAIICRIKSRKGNASFSPYRYNPSIVKVLFYRYASGLVA